MSGLFRSQLDLDLDPTQTTKYLGLNSRRDSGICGVAGGVDFRRPPLQRGRGIRSLNARDLDDEPHTFTLTPNFAHSPTPKTSPENYQREIAQLKRQNAMLTAAAMVGGANGRAKSVAGAREQLPRLRREAAEPPPQPEGGSTDSPRNGSKSTIGDSISADMSQNTSPQIVIEFSPTLLDPPTTSSGSSDGVLVRNKIEIDKTYLKLVMLHRRIERMSQDATNGKHTEILQQSGDVIDILSSLQDTNHQNESTIKTLQKQLIRVTRERDTARRYSEKFQGHVEELEKEIHQERVVFAVVSQKHKHEIEPLKRKVHKLRGEIKFMKCQMKEQERMTLLNEMRKGMKHLEVGGEGATEPFEGTLDREGLITPNLTRMSEVSYWKDKYNKSNMLNDELLDKICQVWVGESPHELHNDNADTMTLPTECDSGSE